MPTFKLSHLEARDFICCCCGIKLKSRKKIMPSEETKVKLIALQSQPKKGSKEEVTIKTMEKICPELLVI